MVSRGACRRATPMLTFTFSMFHVCFAYLTCFVTTCTLITMSIHMLPPLSKNANHTAHRYAQTRTERYNGVNVYNIRYIENGVRAQTSPTQKSTDYANVNVKIEVQDAMSCICMTDTGVDTLHDPYTPARFKFTGYSISINMYAEDIRYKQHRRTSWGGLSSFQPLPANLAPTTPVTDIPHPTLPRIL